MTLAEMNIGKESRAILINYADFLSSRLDIDADDIMAIGMGCKPLVQAEFLMHGPRMYEISTALALRNLLYSATVMDRRADTLDGLKLVEPILDYGCGMGFTLLFLKKAGCKDLYGWDLPGVQASLAREYLDLNGIRWEIPQNPGTVMCNNVLEHTAEPMELLGKLRMLGGNLMANCCESDEPDHIAPVEERRAVIASLKEQGQWCDFNEGMELSWSS